MRNGKLNGKTFDNKSALCHLTWTMNIIMEQHSNNKNQQ